MHIRRMNDHPQHSMDDSLRLIQYLYGETVDDPEFPRRVADDEDLRRELDEMQETKAALDRRSSPSPDPDVVDRVVDRAAEATRTDRTVEHAPDRAARAPGRAWTRRLQNAGAALALLLAVGAGWWYMPADTASSGPATSESSPQQAPSTAAASEQTQDDEALPEWDDSDEVVRLHRRIELLQTQSRPDAWGGDLQPASRANP
jgi:hypothetical protein